MPTSPPRRCRRCGELVKGRCLSCGPWADKPPSWSRLSGAERSDWADFRAAWLAAYPWCMDCGAPAVVVCHRVGTDYTRDRFNPAAIEGQRCRPCDAVETARQGGRARRT